MGMLVFGDGERIEATALRLDRVAGLVDEADAMPPGIGRHALMVAALIEAGELAQGIADEGFRAARQVDSRRPDTDAAMRLTMALARAVTTSWAGGFAPDGARVAAIRAAHAALAAMALPRNLSTRPPEGFAFYALYPEAYAEAAATLPPDPPPVLVGIRSVGTTLAAIVAAANPATALGDSADPPATFRPVGHPFAREVRPDPDLARHLASTGAVAVIDEGPGLSGSSMAAVARFAEGAGVPLSSIHLMPGHDGPPGAAASDEVRRIWRGASRTVRGFEDVILHAAEPAHRLQGWVEEIVGPLQGPLLDISGGAWRNAHAIPPALWPPVHPWQERRKFLARTAGGTWLVKFAGLGRHGIACERRARVLAEAGFTPEVAGWRHGFLVERWQGEARPLSRVPDDRAGLVDHLAAYLGFRALSCPVDGWTGASVAALHAMACHNAREAGLDDVSGLARWPPRLATLEARRRPVATDGRLHLWEWLDAAGGLIKTDAVDHGAGHDLVGPQDIAWDIAGAAVEFGLDDAETDRLMDGIERRGGRVDAVLAAVMRPCYLAFQLGAYVMAAEAASGEENVRLRTMAARYRLLLAESLEGT